MQDKEIKCPKCGSNNYYYEGFWIECHDCKYKKYAKVVNGKIQGLEKWGIDNV